MITSPVTKAQLERWKALWREKGPALLPNRISGEELYGWFRETYSPVPVSWQDLEDAVRFNLAQRSGAAAADAAEILCCRVEGDVYVGMDLRTGFFHLECETVEKAVPIHDALFVRRGLDREDLQNFVLTGQYLELSGL